MPEVDNLLTWLKSQTADDVENSFREMCGDEVIGIQEMTHRSEPQRDILGQGIELEDLQTPLMHITNCIIRLLALGTASRGCGIEARRLARRISGFVSEIAVGDLHYRGGMSGG